MTYLTGFVAVDDNHIIYFDIPATNHFCPGQLDKIEGSDRAYLISEYQESDYSG